MHLVIFYEIRVNPTWILILSQEVINRLNEQTSALAKESQLGWSTHYVDGEGIKAYSLTY